MQVLLQVVLPRLDRKIREGASQRLFFSDPNGDQLVVHGGPVCDDNSEAGSHQSVTIRCPDFAVRTSGLTSPPSPAIQDISAISIRSIRIARELAT